MDKFKVGDRVRVTECGDYHAFSEKELPLIATVIESYYPADSGDVCLKYGDTSQIMKESEVDLIPAFKDGDKVRFIGVHEEMFFEDFTIGEVYTVVERDHLASDEVIVKDKDGGEQVYMKSINFELVEDENPSHLLLSKAVFIDNDGAKHTVKRSKCRHYYYKVDGQKQKRLSKSEVEGILRDLVA